MRATDNVVCFFLDSFFFAYFFSLFIRDKHTHKYIPEVVGFLVLMSSLLSKSEGRDVPMCLVTKKKESVKQHGERGEQMKGSRVHAKQTKERERREERREGREESGGKRIERWRNTNKCNRLLTYPENLGKLLSSACLGIPTQQAMTC